MAITLRPSQNVQVQSFWNLIQSSDERVQKELYVLLQRKYKDENIENKEDSTSFLRMKGILKGTGSIETDRAMLDEYMKEKYGV